MHELQLPVATEVHHFHRRGSQGTLWWIWRVPEEPVDTHNDLTMQLVHKVTRDIEVYQT